MIKIIKNIAIISFVLIIFIPATIALEIKHIYEYIKNIKRFS